MITFYPKVKAKSRHQESVAAKIRLTDSRISGTPSGVAFLLYAWWRKQGYGSPRK